jgi:hypothetical protein
MDRRAGKVLLAHWDEWAELCREQNEDPREVDEITIGLDCGNYFTVKPSCDPPKEVVDERRK